jgi:hypothetical protein
MRTWVVIYQTNTGFVYGWLCKAHRVSDAEQEFWRETEITSGRTIKCIATLESDVIGSLISLYKEGE